MKTGTAFIFLGSNHCGPEIKRCLPLGRKAMPNLVVAVVQLPTRI